MDEPLFQVSLIILSVIREILTLLAVLPQLLKQKLLKYVDSCSSRIFLSSYPRKLWMMSCCYDTLFFKRLYFCASALESLLYMPLQVAVDIATRVFHPSMWDIRLNHDRVLDSVWSWIGIDDEMRQSVAKVYISNDTFWRIY